MGELERNDLKIIKSDDKTYNLENTEEAIDFLIYALNGKYYTLFIDFVFGHLGINFYDYLNSLEDKGKNIFVVLNDVSPFFDLIVEDFESNNVFYTYIYSYQSSDLIKKQKINKIIDGLKKTIDFNFDFHNASIFRNMYIEMDKDFYKLAYKREFSSAYIYFCVTDKLMSIYDYLQDEFYSFIEERNKFDYFYSNKYKDFIKAKKEEKAIKMNHKETKIDSVNPFPDIFKSIDIYNSFKEYSNKYIIDPYKDYSYLFQRMLYEKLIHKKKLLEYINWLKEVEIISPATHQKFFEKGGLDSLKKSTSANRENNFNIIFKL